MKTIKVSAAIIRSHNKVFATARGYGDYKGQWEFPGGKIEPGESPQQALIREIKEELEPKSRSESRLGQSNTTTRHSTCPWTVSGAVLSGAIWF